MNVADDPTASDHDELPHMLPATKAPRHPTPVTVLVALGVAVGDAEILGGGEALGLAPGESEGVSEGVELELGHTTRLATKLNMSTKMAFPDASEVIPDTLELQVAESAGPLT